MMKSKNSKGLRKSVLSEGKPKKDLGVRIITFCLVGNVFLLLLKGIVGLLVGSEVLKADAVNSAGDSLSAVVVLLGLRYAMKPQDKEHQYGHGKMEALVSLIVGVMVLAGTVFVVRDAVTAAFSEEIAQPSLWALGAALVCIAIKAVMYHFTRSAGKRLNSVAVMTSAMDHRNDIYATSGAAFAIGLGFLGQGTGFDPLVRYSEPVIAVVISALIVKTALSILKVSSQMLLDAAPDDETMSGLRSVVITTPGTLHLSWLKCRRMGRGLLVDAAIEVDAKIHVSDGHEIADAVRDAVMTAYPQVIDVVVHVNPDTL